ncbi:MAG: hypothetical protein AB8G99_04190 [Planctomycetaceae bacterium]
MGTWTLNSVRAEISDHTTGELYGNNVKAVFQLTYRPATMEKYKETPMLSWKETIMMNEHHKSETWVFNTNMYEHNPLSRTLEIWAKRYLVAYDTAHGIGYTGKGYCKLLDKQMRPVQGDKLGRQNTKAEKADAVRNYLKSKGGGFEIQVHDIPSINIPKPQDNTHKERLLLFDCGIVGGGPTVKAYQHLVVNGNLARNQWVRKAGQGWGVSGIKTTGLKNTQPPIMVSRKRDALFAQGECW